LVVTYNYETNNQKLFGNPIKSLNLTIHDFYFVKTLWKGIANTSGARKFIISSFRSN